MNRYKMIWVNGKCIGEHRVIAEKAYGPIPKGYVVNHKNGIKNDNRPDNLEVVTRSQDRLHAWRTGLRKNTLTNYRGIGDRDSKCPSCGWEYKLRVKQPKKCPNPKCQHIFVKYPEPKK